MAHCHSIHGLWITIACGASPRRADTILPSVNNCAHMPFQEISHITINKISFKVILIFLNFWDYNYNIWPSSLLSPSTLIYFLFPFKFTPLSTAITLSHIYIYISKYNMLSLYFVTCMYVIRPEYLVLKNQPFGMLFPAKDYCSHFHLY